MQPFAADFGPVVAAFKTPNDSDPER